MSAGMLKDILDAERNARLALANEKAAIAVEHAAIVAGIHAEFDKHMPELSGLMLIGDYGRPVPIKLGGGFRAGKNDHGITIDLGKTIGSEQLELRITRRSADTAPIASLPQLPVQERPAERGAGALAGRDAGARPAQHARQAHPHGRVT